MWPSDLSLDDAVYSLSAFTDTKMPSNDILDAF